MIEVPQRGPINIPWGCYKMPYFHIHPVSCDTSILV